MTKIEVFGTGCAKCKRTAKNVETAVKELGIAAEVV
ncbi:thioredoxin family protein, partial [uncultured Methanofollis sp.]